MSKLFLLENRFTKVEVPAVDAIKFVVVDTGEVIQFKPEVFTQRMSYYSSSLDETFNRMEVSMMIDGIGLKMSYRELINLYHQLSNAIDKIGNVVSRG